ncbi:hypothetical protein [Streptomyces sp. NPDC003077]|uniref:hypothetical protein n=1 Tax=Streptomyces sp. NPDC003077 TaxID=3154443 RepID=UPI00339DF2C9
MESNKSTGLVGFGTAGGPGAGNPAAKAMRALSGKAGEAAVTHVARGVGDAIGQLGGQLVESQRVRHETRRLVIEHEASARREADAAERREREKQNDFVRARLTADHEARLAARSSDQEHHQRMAEAELAARFSHQKHHRRVAEMGLRAEYDILAHTERARRKAERKTSPFQVDSRAVRDHALGATRSFSRPLLLVAPFHSRAAGESGSATDPEELLLSFLHTWDAQPWCEDMGRLVGVFRRPLSMFDLDVSVIRQALDDVPTVLVSGEIDRAGHLWINVIGWNLLPEAEDRPPAAEGQAADAYRIVLPAVADDREGGARDPAGEQAFRDEVAASALLVAEVYAEWFHSARGRPPSLHRRLPAPAGAWRGAIAAGSAAMVGIAVERGLLHPVFGLLVQARTYLEGGHTESALVLARRAARELRTGSRPGPQPFLEWTRRTAALLRELGEPEEAASLLANAEDIARDLILGRHDLGPRDD